VTLGSLRCHCDSLTTLLYCNRTISNIPLSNYQITKFLKLLKFHIIKNILFSLLYLYIFVCLVCDAFFLVGNTFGNGVRIEDPRIFRRQLGGIHQSISGLEARLYD
jgi:hypothetical protein